MHLIRKAIQLACLVALITGCAGGITAFNKAEQLERDGKLDEAVIKFAEAARENPAMGEYRMRFLKASATAAQVHLKKGDDFLDEEKLDDALREYQTASTLDPSLNRGKQQSDLVEKLRNSLFYYQEGVQLEKERKPKDALRSYRKALSFNANNEAAKEAVERLLKSKRTKLDGAELNLKSTKPITLKFKDAKTKEVFNILSKLSGINFIFDEGLKDANISIYLENATFQQALEVLTGTNKLGKKVLNESTIILYPKNPEKTKQYEELFVQTFYLNKLDAKKAVNLIRTMLQVKKIYVNEEMNALVIRDTPDVIEVAQKILEANDVPDAEVVLEVEVMEINKTNAENFGLLLSQYAVTMNTLTPDGQFFTDTFTPLISAATGTTTGGVAATTSPVTPSNLLKTFSWGGYQGFITVPNATFNFAKSLANGETLANPRLRIKNREKAKFNVGQRVPITTTSSPTGGGVSVNVQYVDVGVKVNAEPTVQLNNEVNMKVSLEVSSILSKETVGGRDSATTVVTIGTRNLDTVLSLKDGETSIIGGLLQDIKTNDKKKVFLLGDIPVIGTLFTNTNSSANKTELVLAITPRIVRGFSIPDADVAAFWSGKEDEPSTAKPYSSFLQEPDLIPAAPAPAAPAPAPAAPAPAPAAPAPAAGASPDETATPAAAQTPVSPSPAVQPPSPAVPTTPSVPSIPLPPQAPAGTAQAQVVEDVPPPQPVTRTSVTITAPKSAKINEQFNVEVQVSNVSNLYSAPLLMVYDPIFVDFVGTSEGGFLKKDGKPTLFRTTVDKNTGLITVTLNRVGEVGGVNGTGTLLTATFKAKNKGPASLGFMGVNFAEPGGKPLEAIPYNTSVEIK